MNKLIKHTNYVSKKAEKCTANEHIGSPGKQYKERRKKSKSLEDQRFKKPITFTKKRKTTPKYFLIKRRAITRHEGRHKDMRDLIHPPAGPSSSPRLPSSRAAFCRPLTPLEWMANHRCKDQSPKSSLSQVEADQTLNIDLKTLYLHADARLLQCFVSRRLSRRDKNWEEKD